MRLTNSRCQCGGCGLYFTSTSAFDKHRTGRYANTGEWQGTRRCLTTAEMDAKGMALRTDGVWAGSKDSWRPRA